MNLFNEETTEDFKTQSQAEKIRQSITNKNTPFDKIRKRMLKEITNS